MYFATVILLLLVLPVLSIAFSASHAAPTVPLLLLVGRWFTFWAVGVRLLIAGLRQVIQPRFTAEEIFRISDSAVLPLVREIGYGNLSMGFLGISTLLRPEWILPAAIVGGLYYGLAGVGHIPQKHKNAKENTAMLSDLFIFFILLLYSIKTLA